MAVALCLIPLCAHAVDGIHYPWKFGVLSDTHAAWGFGLCGGVSNTLPLRACVDTLNSMGVDFCILNGDWGGGQVWLLHQKQIDSLYAALITRAQFPIWPVLGNHEAHKDDTLAVVNPYAQAIARFPGYFQGKNYYYKDWKNLRFIALNTNVNYDVHDPGDYLVNNPFGYSAIGGVPALDYDGLHSATGTQRVWLANTLATRNKNHWLLVGGHRGVYGSSANNPYRYNYNAGRAGRYVKQMEDSLLTGERGAMIFGDEHLPHWLTYAIRDSALAGPTEKGFFHFTVASGSGAREGDSTEVFGGAGLQSFVYYDTATVSNQGRTRGGWLENMTLADDLGLPCQFTFAVGTVTGDHMFLEFFRTWTEADSGAVGYNGAGHHSLITWATLSRDN